MEFSHEKKLAPERKCKFVVFKLAAISDYWNRSTEWEMRLEWKNLYT